MSRIQEILLRVRDTLNDHSKQRWPDDTLLRNLNQGITDIAVQTKLFKNTTAIPLVYGRDVYQLPDNLLKLTHCTFNWKPLPLRSSSWMDDNRETDWRYTMSDDVQIAVFDEVKRRELRMYPRPFGEYDTIQAEFDSVYGVTVGIAGYDIDSPYGVIGDLTDPDVHAEAQGGAYGVLASMGAAQAVVLYYTECPALPTSIDAALPLDPCFDTALKHYICAIALRNDMDTQNRSMANEEFVLYQRDLGEIADIATVDSVTAQHFESGYNALG